MSTTDLSNWKPLSLPQSKPMVGRTVTLEPLEIAHHTQPLWEAFKGYDALWTWMAQGPFANASEMMASQVKWQQANRAIPFAIVPREGAATGAASGWASYMRIEPAHGVVEVGNVMFSPALQRTPAATEAMYLMARHIFEDLGYRRYEWKCDSNNLPSRRAAERLGFTFEGIFRQHMVVKGRNRDTAWFAMLDHEWPARKRAFEAWLNPENFDAKGGQLKPLAVFAAEMNACE